MSLEKQALELIQGVVVQDCAGVHRCEGCGEPLEDTDLGLALAAHGDGCALGVAIAAYYLIQHVTGRGSSASIKIVRVLNEQAKL